MNQNALREACEGHIFLSPFMTPESDYPWSFRELDSAQEMVDITNYDIAPRTGYVLGNLALVSNGSREWVALRRGERDSWAVFERISFPSIWAGGGEAAVTDMIRTLSDQADGRTPAEPIRFHLESSLTPEEAAQTDRLLKEQGRGTMAEELAAYLDSLEEVLWAHHRAVEMEEGNPRQARADDEAEMAPDAPERRIQM